MRLFTFLLALACCLAWIILLDRPAGSVPAVGKLMDPVKGFWANADPVEQTGPPSLPWKSSGLLSVSLDERLVPHIRAANDEDLYKAQGYLHACYRLWQMDMQTRAAAGRISEVAGEKAFAFDRKQRRKGMVWAAENSLKAMEADPTTKKVLDAYTKGVNLYISRLRYRDYPLEYKLMGFAPEPWTNLKCALLLKYMADDLTGSVDDIAMSYLHDALPAAELDDLFPEKIKDNQPVIPAGTAFAAASLPVPAVPPGNLFSHFDTSRNQADTGRKTAAAFRSASGIGSNNWALSGKRTSDSAAILCNDPHLGLNLPSIWYELQLTGPDISCYGVSIPGAPGIIIGFNDSISWGVTNNYRDVKDYYEIISKDSRLYLFDGKEVPFNERREAIYIKGKDQPFIDTIRFTIHGPVLYDERFPEPSGSGKMLAVTWMAHRATNELLSVYRYNRARNYGEFVNGIRYFECPAQNFIYADRAGNIALWGQGRFINKWKDQGKYVMRGDISATLWGDTIPTAENPHVLNPPQGYLASANQAVTDNSYPYWYNGDFSEFRSWEINHFLGNDSLRQDVSQMMALQNNNWSYLSYKLSELMKPPASLRETGPSPGYHNELSPGSVEATFFQVWYALLYQDIWQDEFRNFPDKLYPSSERTMQLLVNDSVSKYYDDITTPQKEGLKDMLLLSYKQTMDSIRKLESSGGAAWYLVKNTSVTHLAKLAAFSYEALQTGGWGNTINAMKHDHGPSWRMIVKMKPGKLEAYGVYPGGQSGNPGSKYYASFLDYWVAGKYYPITFKAR
ncbi:penicillin acylase family protein [Taibaiella koreensis]|uniref:penicillin acylase family protein n=1 Tax=Taibaiella koreensis TaxID=1268548 RepID=UPI000E59CEFB|nr:penicillin acylase family protein [Taibaiella koreensis]